MKDRQGGACGDSHDSVYVYVCVCVCEGNWKGDGLKGHEGTDMYMCVCVCVCVCVCASV